MQMAALSIGTVIFILALMNGAGMILVLAYLPVSGERRLLKIFAVNKLVHGASWFFRFLDAIATQPSYRFLADFLFIAGCATEAGIYKEFMHPWRALPLMLYAAAGTLAAGLCSWFAIVHPGLQIWLLGAAMVFFLWLAAIQLLRPPRRAFRTFMALAYFLLPLLLSLAFIMDSSEIELMFMVPDLCGILLFAVAFMLQMLLVFGFFLMSKELNEERMKILADTDSLTGVANRRAFFQRMENYLKSTAANPPLISVILMDLDHFKRINDTYGHQTGDRVIQHFCAVVQASIRDKDFFARFGGEEFMLFLPETDRNEAELVANRIHERLRNSRNRVGEDIPAYTVSLGISTGRLRTQPDLSRIISFSDRALYHSKTNGRDCISWTGGDSLEAIEPASC